mmetsp:Transcript_21678/g.41404  ORF Transcript_21678/g.41404 Transcript_21678/m.41404 type:complete len:264 (+) Transcript_21678:600-1391(+)
MNLREPVEPAKRDVLLKWVRGVRKAYIKRGLSHAVGAAAISSLYLIQELVGGFEPGIEFLAAGAMVRHMDPEPIIVLGDDDVSNTISKLTDIKVITRDFLSPTAISHQLGVMSRALGIGPIQPSGQASSTHDSVNLLQAALHVGWDVGKILLPLAALGWPVANLLLTAVHSGDSAVSEGSLLPGGWVSLVIDGLLITCVPRLWLRLGEIIVSERDIILARNVMRVCNSQSPPDTGSSTSLVVIVGVLHCNGVAAKIVSDNAEA